MKYYDKLIFELSKEGRRGCSLPPDGWTGDLGDIPQNLRRQNRPALPQVSEPDAVRHYTCLSGMNFGVDNGFYPLGSCTMKYNPRINEEVASLPGFASVHPLQPGLLQCIRFSLIPLSRDVCRCTMNLREPCRR